MSGREEIVREERKERIGLSNGKEFICGEELRRIGLSGREEFFSGRRIGQFAYLSGRKELVAQKRNLFVKKKRLFKI